jgi:hypothetical protein
VTDQAVVRYEGREPAFGGAADMLLRLLIAGHAISASDPIQLVEEIRESDDANEDRLGLDVWKIAA